MHLRDIIPQGPSDVADWSDMAALQKRMANSVTALAGMASDVGMAKHILEYDSDRRKRALARAMAAPLAGDSSVSKAEAEARASESYAKELMQLGKEHAVASQTIQEWDALKLIWETCRSLISMHKESIRHL